MAGPSDETIFADALRLPTAEERNAFLDQACGGNDALRRDVEALLAAHQRARGFLESPPAQVDPSNSSAAEQSGSVVGPYKLLEQIGEGGMGTVFMAEQLRPVQRRVALKIIKPGLDSKQVIARFEAERQALALMDHPCIAKVFDAGVTDAGRSYFAMELVRGVPINEYCDAHQLTPRERLQLFVQVCSAVQHAHQKGIIHRDLKPSNVLVTLNDDKPVPKIIDFGIAKATAGQRLTDRTLFTQFRELIGTPLYMSPEQAEMSAVMDVDTRSDVYSLGVLLYELLTGTTPFDKQRLATAAFDEVRRIIREEEPPRPSTRLSTLGDTLATVCAQRQTEPKKLSQTVRGELDWIVMRALEKDRTRRYETAIGLAHDLERYLADQPVAACPPSRTYRLRKFARRNKPAIATAAVIATVLVVATLVSIWQAVRAQRATAIAVREADHARSEADKQRAVNDFLNTMLRSASPWTRNSSEPSNGKDVTVLEAINAAVRKLDAGALRDHPEIEAAVRRSIGVTYQGLDRLDFAEVQLREALRLSQAANGEETLDVAESMIALGWCKMHRGEKLDDVDPLLRGGVAMQRKFLGKVPGAGFLCELLLRENKPVEAEKLAREALELDPSAVLPLANALRNQHRFAEAEPLYKQAITNDKQRDGENSLAVQGDLYELSTLFTAQSKWLQAEAAITDALAINHARGMDEVTMREYLARILLMQSKFVEAEQDLREARRLNPQRSDLAFHLANVLQHQSKNADAARAIQEGMSLWEEQTRGQFASADTSQQRTAIYLSLVDTLVRCRLAKEARETFQKVVELRCDDVTALNEIAWALVVTPHRDFYDPALGLRAAQRAVELAPNAANQWNTLGVALYRTGDYAKAIDALGKSRPHWHGNDFFSHDAFFLAMAHYRLGHLDVARNWYAQSIAWMDKNAPKDQELLLFRSEASELLHVASAANAAATQPASQPAGTQASK